MHLCFRFPHTLELRRHHLQHGKDHQAPGAPAEGRAQTTPTLLNSCYEAKGKNNRPESLEKLNSNLAAVM